MRSKLDYTRMIDLPARNRHGYSLLDQAMRCQEVSS